MRNYEVELVVEPFDMDDDPLICRVQSMFPDIALSICDDLFTVADRVEGENGEAAARTFIADLRERAPEIVPVRMASDLVTVDDIASRTDQEVDTVRGYLATVSFPAHRDVADGTAMWEWPVVVGWLEANTTYREGNSLLTWQEVARANVFLAD